MVDGWRLLALLSVGAVTSAMFGYCVLYARRYGAMRLGRRRMLAPWTQWAQLGTLIALFWPLAAIVASRFGEPLYIDVLPWLSAGVVSAAVWVLPQLVFELKHSADGRLPPPQAEALEPDVGATRSTGRAMRVG